MHEGDSENAVTTESSNLIKSFNREGTSIHESMIKFFKRDDRKKKLRHHHHSGSFSYDYFGLKDLTARDNKTLHVVLTRHSERKLLQLSLINQFQVLVTMNRIIMQILKKIFN